MLVTLNAGVFFQEIWLLFWSFKGKGFQGVVKTTWFHGGPRSHGQKHSEREPGSIGGGLRNPCSQRYAYGRPNGTR